MWLKPVFITFIIIIFSTFAGCVLFGSDDNGDEEYDVDAFEASDLSVPDSRDMGYFNEDYTKPDSDNTHPNTPFKYKTTWAFAYNTVYSELGGIMQLWITNLGETEMYIYEFGISAEWLSENVSAPSNKALAPSSEAELGYLAFEGPISSGTYDYQLIFGVMSRTNASSSWFDWGVVGNKTYQMDVQSPKKSSELVEYSVEYNIKSLHEKINSLIDPMQKDVRSIAVNLAKKFDGPYNVYQLCEIFEYIKTNISYVSDPRGDENYWSTPEETCSLGAGDCEDQAVLFSALVSSIDGTARVYITDTHAFAGVYIGNSASIRDEILSAINTYYSTELRFAWLKDELGYWLMVDTINAMHPGGLPLGAEPVDTSSGTLLTGSPADNSYSPWDFTDTKELIIIDVI